MGIPPEPLLIVDPKERGKEREAEFAEEFGLSLVPGSGNQWHSKLDVSGQGVRWSLKWTGKDSYRITKKDVEEAIEATRSLSGTGEIPMWAFDVAGHDMVMMRKDDFKQMQVGELKVLPEKRTKTAERERLSNIPVLMRDDE